MIAPALPPITPRQAALRADDQPVLPEGSARELRQARAHSHARTLEHRRHNARALGSEVLGREPAPGPTAQRSGARSRRHHRASHLRAPGVRDRGMVQGARLHRRHGRPSRALLPRGSQRRTRMPSRSATACAALAADSSKTSSAASSKREYQRRLQSARTPPIRPPVATSFRTTPSSRQRASSPPAAATTAAASAISRRMACTCRIACARRNRSRMKSAQTASPTPSSSTTTSARGRTISRKLCQALKPLGIIWSAAVTIDVTDDPSLVREMALAGCTGVFIGFESLHGDNLTDARKKTPAPMDYARRVAILHRYGIQVNGSFVLGFDHDGPDVFERTVEWIEANRLGMRHVPHPHALSRDAAVPAVRERRPPAPSQLGSLRHRARRLPAEAHVTRRARERLRVVLRNAVLSSLHLASPPAGHRRRARLSRDELSLQALESLLAPAHPSPAHGARVAAARGAGTTATSEVSPPARKRPTRSTTNPAARRASSAPASDAPQEHS